MRRPKRLTVSLDEISSYLARGAELHPILYSEYRDQLLKASRLGFICLTPEMIFECYHYELQQRIEQRRLLRRKAA